MITRIMLVNATRITGKHPHLASRSVNLPVRIGAATNELSESIETGAALMDADLPEIRRRVSPPSTYLLRNVEKRRDAVRKFGGTRESEDAVERSLKWLSRNQSSDGRWDAEDFGPDR